MKKRLAALTLAVCLVLSGCGAKPAASSSVQSTEKGIYTPGTYTASAAGMGGDVVVEMTFDEDTILTVNAVGEKETPGIGSLALEQIPGRILDKQSAEVDAVATATITSDAIIAAAAKCIDQAKGIETAAEEQAAEETADVIVIGAGGAGLAAAAGAGQNGASVIVLEANGIVGGSTIRSGGHILVFEDEINASMDRNDDALQKYLSYNPADFGEWGETLATLQQQVQEYLTSDTTGRFDSVEMALVDHYLKGQGTDKNGTEVTQDYELCKAAFENATALNEWLCESGMELQQKMYNTHGGTPVNGASGLVSALQTAAEEAGAKIVLNMRATELLMEGSKVVGVVAQDADGKNHTYHANKGVVMATGSFSSNGELAAQYQTMGEGLGADNGSTNPATNIGDGILMAESAGAQLRDMGFLCTLLTGYHEGCTTKEFGTINGSQQLILNADGKRFMSDAKAGGMATVGGINDQPDGLAYFIGDAKMIETLNAASDGFVEDMASRGDWFVVADTLEEALEKAGLDVSTAMESIQAFNGYVDAGEDPEFGRTSFNGKVEEGPFVVAKMESHYHLTFGGLVINTDAEVLDEAGNAIENLYAAGDVISGFEGATHQSGDCLTVVLYYGKVAGEQAAKN